jgi:ketosteroid isomerase-like protein
VSQENVELVRRALAAFNARDIDGYLACCAADIQLENLLSAIEGEYTGHVAIRRFFDDIAAAAPDFTVNVESLEAIGTDRVLAFVHVTASGRVSGIASDTPTANLYDVADGRIKRLRVFLDRVEALKAVGLEN